MAIALDANMLILLFDGKASAPIDPTTGQPVTYCQERLRHFLDVFSRPKGAKIVIPTPALAEFLVKVDPDRAVEYISQIQRIRGCAIVPFSARACIEFADMQRAILAERPRKKRPDVESRAKAKFDHQIVAIAKCEGVTSIYSDDDGLGKFAARVNIERVGVASLPIPPKSLQGVLPLEPPEPELTRDDSEDLD